MRRGGVSLAIPEQVITQREGGYGLQFRAPLPVEQWNAQISLMTGMAAAELMLEGDVGLLRTVPVADPERLERLRLTAKALQRGVAGGASPTPTSSAASARSSRARRRC